MNNRKLLLNLNTIINLKKESRKLQLQILKIENEKLKIENISLKEKLNNFYKELDNRAPKPFTLNWIKKYCFENILGTGIIIGYLLIILYFDEKYKPFNKTCPPLEAFINQQTEDIVKIVDNVKIQEAINKVKLQLIEELNNETNEDKRINIKKYIEILSDYRCFNIMKENIIKERIMQEKIDNQNFKIPKQINALIKKEYENKKKILNTINIKQNNITKNNKKSQTFKNLQNITIEMLNQNHKQNIYKIPNNIINTIEKTDKYNNKINMIF